MKSILKSEKFITRNRLLLIISMLTLNQLMAQPMVTNPVYQQGLAELKKGNTDSAIRLFEKSINTCDDAASCFELGKIYMDLRTIYGNEKARDFFRQAIWKEPENIEYRLTYADLMKRMKINNQSYYEKILKIDSTNAKAWFELGRIHENEFYEYHHSRKAADEMLLSYDEFAEDDYKHAEYALKKAVQLNPNDYRVNMHLCRLYQEVGLPAEAIPYAETLITLNPDSLDLSLLYGILLYDAGNKEASQNAIQNALSLMSDEDKEVFEYQTVITLFDKNEKEKLEKNSEAQIKEIIKEFWSKRDPLYLTGYNERLLEHYVRVAYANLKFSIPGKVKGWETDRGESVIRYGRPEIWIRLRPQLILQTDGLAMEAKTDVWNYRDMTLAFTDEFSSGNFRFSLPSLPGNNVRTQYPIDTELFMRGLRNSMPEKYEPDFGGSAIDVPFEILQFKSSDSTHTGMTDIVINYEMDPARLTDTGVEALPRHDYGIFFMKNGFEKKSATKKEVYEREHTIIRNRQKMIVNSIVQPMFPDSGMLAFEISRYKDQGISSSHLPWVTKSFDGNTLSMSDIMLGSAIEFKPSGKSYLKRKNIYILSNPSHHFSGIKSLNVYYEIYNLNFDINQMTNFEQKIRIESYTNKGDGNFLSKIYDNITKMLGLRSDGQIVELRTPYQTQSKDTQVYFELEMGNYSPGEYKLSIEVNDNLSGQLTKQSQIFYVD